VGVEPISFDQVVQNAMEKLDALVGTFQGPEGQNIGKNLAVTVENLRRISDSLRVALADQESKLVEMVSNFHSFSQDIAEISAENKEGIKAAIQNISDVSVKLDRVLGKIDQGEGTFGKLVSDKEMGEDLKSTFADLKETSKEAKRALKRINLIEVQWDYKLRYDVRDTVAHHDVGLRVLPRPDKFYFLGASNVARPSDVTTPDPEELNTLNVLIGKNYKQGQAYVGIIRSSGGVGLKVRPFKWDPLRRLEVTAEGYNFFRKAPVAKPKYNLGANIQLTRWANVGAQIEDPYYQSATNVYANVVVRDDDLGYILGLVGLARPY
jgi:phospholipid/cholesterol/gamma-HCH transport system substrate-binding protein